MFVDKLKTRLQNLAAVPSRITRISAELVRIKSILGKLQEAAGRLENRQLQNMACTDIHANEFRVFSQWGEDGIIQFLLRNIEVPRKIFIEFGVQDYTESNTRFLLINDNWSGLIMDSSADDINYIKNDPIYWQYNIKALQSFITRENINRIISENGIRGDIGLLSIDVDGNDYWIWEALNIVNPSIVVIEYNHRFGVEKAVTIPYADNFVRSQAHHSMIYYGASLKALYLLGSKKGYSFVGCNSAGNNAFFVRRDLKPPFLKEVTPEVGFVPAQFRESRDEKGRLLHLSLEEEQALLASLPLVEVG